MSATTDKSQTAQQRSGNGLDTEALRNLVRFFQLLLKIDMRINPHLYAANGTQRNPDPADQT